MRQIEENKMMLLAPTRSLEITKMQIKAGADEVYLGLSNKKYATFSFNGRFKEMDSVSAQVKDEEELKKIVEVCHNNGVKVNYAANVHHIAPELEDEYLEYVKKGVSAGVDYLIISNIGLVKLVRKANIDLPIVMGAFALIPNVEHVRMLRDIGVKRVVLPHAVKLEELRDFCKIDGIEVEVFGFIGGGNNCGRCMLLHSPNKKEIAAGCRAGYTVESSDGKKFEQELFLDAAADCALCNIPDLINIGVDVIKIIGRESAMPSFTSKVVNLFRKAIDGSYEGKDIEDIKEKFSREEEMWNINWKPRFCEKGRCKFKSTKITNSYI